MFTCKCFLLISYKITFYALLIFLKKFYIFKRGKRVSILICDFFNPWKKIVKNMKFLNIFQK